MTLKRAQSSREIAQDARLHQVTVEAAQALNQADDLTSRVARAADLAARFPERPQTITEDDDLATLVAGALSAYRQRPDAPNPPTHCSVDIKLELDAIPEMPEGDLEAPPGVASAHTASADARRRLELHEETPPSEAVLPDARGLTADELRHLADTVAQNEAAPDSLPPPDFLPHASPESAPLRSWRGHMLVGIGGALAILGAVVAVAVGVVAGLVTLAVGVVVALAGLTHLVLRQAQPALDEGQIRAEAARRVEEDLTRQREDALHELGEHGLPEGPDALRTLADQLTTATHDQRASAQWHERDTELREALETADGNFRRELSGRDVNAAGPIDDAWSGYVRSCEERNLLATHASRRPSLEAQLAAAQSEEASVQHARRLRKDADAAVRDAATQCGMAGAGDRDADDLVAALEGWLEQRTERVRIAEAAQREWQELQGLLDGHTLEQLEAQRDRANAYAGELATDIEADQVAEMRRRPNLDTELRTARVAAQTALGDESRADGEIHTLGADLPNVAEAEEALTAAIERLASVRRLDRTLELTANFLQQAQDEVHHNIAVILAEPLRERLPHITGDRYVDVLVDPRSLEVKVRTGAGVLREAALLSHGTSEQIYLLLRVALAEHLTNGETCPLLLDDVTTQTDPARTPAVLALLHEISATHQVILFSQEEDVRAWAQSHLTEPRDRLICLDPSLIAP